MSTEISKNVNQVPSFMQADNKIGTEDMSKFIVPPRMIIVQSTAKEPLDKYNPGTLIVMPNETVVGEFDKEERCLKEPLIVVPIFFFAAYTLDNPKELWPTKGRCSEYSFDHDSVTAQRAMNPKLREVMIEGCTKPAVYTTRLNFILYLMREDINEAVMFTFKRAEMRKGMDFNSLIKARSAPIFGCQFAVDVSKRSNDKGEWYGLDISNPPADVGPWVANAELYEHFKEEHLKLKEAHEAKLIAPSHDDDEEVEPVSQF